MELHLQGILGQFSNSDVVLLTESVGSDHHSSKCNPTLVPLLLMAATMGKQRLNLRSESCDRKRSRDDTSETASLSAEGVLIKKKRSNFSDAPTTASSLPDGSSSSSSGPSNSIVADDINPSTGRKYSQRYYDILEQRKKLPAWEAKKNFIKLVKKNQVSVVSDARDSCSPHGWNKHYTVLFLFLEVEPAC